MAGRAHRAPPDALLAVLFGLPRPVSSRLVARAFERLDELDGDTDAEDDYPGDGNVEDEGETAAS